MKRLLLAIVDTEGGVPAKSGGGTAPLREVCFLVMGVLGLRERAHPVLLEDLSGRPSPLLWAGGAGEAHVQRFFVPSVRRLCERMDCSGLALLAWNAPHDRAVLGFADWAPLKLHWCCLLRWARKNHPDHETYSLKALMRELGVERRQQHTALSDCLDTEEVIMRLTRARPWSDIATSLRFYPEESAAPAPESPFKRGAAERFEHEGTPYAIRAGWRGTPPPHAGFALHALRRGHWRQCSAREKAAVLAAYKSPGEEV